MTYVALDLPVVQLSSLNCLQITYSQTALGSDTYAQEWDKTFSPDNVGSSSTPKDISVLVPYVDLITRPGRNRRARRNRSPSLVIQTQNISPHKRRKFQKDDSPGETLSPKVYKFYSKVTIYAEPMFQLTQMALERQISPTASDYIFDVRSP